MLKTNREQDRDVRAAQFLAALIVPQRRYRALFKGVRARAEKRRAESGVVVRENDTAGFEQLAGCLQQTNDAAAVGDRLCQ